MAMMTPEHKEATVQHAKRFGGWWLAALVLIVVIGFVANAQLEVLAWKVAVLCVGLLLSYVGDRTMFHNAPDVTCEMSGTVAAARLHSRAILAGAIIIAVAIAI